MKKLILAITLLILVFLIACSPEPVEKQILEEPVEQASEPVEPAETTILPTNISCTYTADCEWGKQCIDGRCGKVDELYDFECDNRCNYKNIIVRTSDGETITLVRGKGSYTGAGAVAWTLMPGPDYCLKDNVPVPIKLENYHQGKVISEEVVVLHKGETSKVITHPKIPRIRFTVTLKSLEEICG